MLDFHSCLLGNFTTVLIPYNMLLGFVVTNGTVCSVTYILGYSYTLLIMCQVPKVACLKAWTDQLEKALCFN